MFWKNWCISTKGFPAWGFTFPPYMFLPKGDQNISEDERKKLAQYLGEISKQTALATRVIGASEKVLETMVDAEKIIMVQNLEKLKSSALEAEEVSIGI